MTQKTPGTWESIPANAEITATRKDLTLKGVLREVSGQHHEKALQFFVEPLGEVMLYARDQWEVTYESEGAGDVMREAPIGTVWGTQMTLHPRIVKISEGFVTRQEERNTQPVVLPISEWNDVDAAKIKAVHPADLARWAEIS